MNAGSIVLIIIGCLFVLYHIWRAWYLSKGSEHDMKAINFFRSFKLISKETLTPEEGKGLPIRKFTFALPEQQSLASLGFDMGLGDFVKVSVNGRGGGKAYSPTSDPYKKGSFDLMVKIYPNGKVSGYLDQTKIGETVYLSGPGPVPWIGFKRRQAKHVGLIAFGIGITELKAIAISELLDPHVKSVRLLWALSYWSDNFMEKELEEMVKQSNGRFSVVYTLSRDTHEGCLSGRVSSKLLRQAFPNLISSLSSSSSSSALQPELSEALVNENEDYQAVDVKIADTGADTCNNPNTSTLVSVNDVMWLAAGTKQMKKDAYLTLEQVGYDKSSILLYKQVPTLPCFFPRQSSPYVQN